MVLRSVFIRCITVAAAFALFCSLGFAQVAPTSPPSAAPPAAEVPKLTRDGKPRAKEVRSSCRDAAKAKDLKPREQPFRSFMRDCIGKQRPDLVKAYDCRQEARDKKVEKAEIRAYIKTCKAKG